MNTQKIKASSILVVVVLLLSSFVPAVQAESNCPHAKQEPFSLANSESVVPLNASEHEVTRYCWIRCTDCGDYLDYRNETEVVPHELTSFEWEGATYVTCETCAYKAKKQAEHDIVTDSVQYSDADEECNPGSYAYQYAKENAIEVSRDDPVAIPVTYHSLLDINKTTYTETVFCERNAETIITANKQVLPYNHEFVGTTQVTIVVDGAGNVSHDRVMFIYQESATPTPNPTPTATPKPTATPIPHICSICGKAEVCNCEEHYTTMKAQIDAYNKMLASDKCYGLCSVHCHASEALAMLTPKPPTQKSNYLSTESTSATVGVVICRICGKAEACKCKENYDVMQGQIAAFEKMLSNGKCYDLCPVHCKNEEPTATPHLTPTPSPAFSNVLPNARSTALPHSGIYNLTVYSGPGENYFIGANGKAVVDPKAEFDVWGNENSWYMICYNISKGKNRVGYIKKDGFTLSTRELDFSWEYAKTVRDVALTDDPDGSQPVVCDIPKGATVYYLATYYGRYGTWYYIEYQGRDIPTRGFIPENSLR